MNTIRKLTLPQSRTNSPPSAGGVRGGVLSARANLRKFFPAATTPPLTPPAEGGELRRFSGKRVNHCPLRSIKRRSQAGFTLVELSIVLVIIALIIGGVLTGTQVMKNAQISNALNSIQAYQAQFQTYVQNYGALPGDDANAATRFANVSGHANIKSGDGSGTLDGAFDATSGETFQVWLHLRAAGLVKDQLAGAASQPPNPFGGIYGYEHTAFNSALTGNVICLSNVPADAAQAIDSRLDDGTASSGTVQAILSSAGATLTTAPDSTNNYVSGQTYTVCVGL